jgi:hypothetical protein
MNITYRIGLALYTFFLVPEKWGCQATRNALALSQVNTHRNTQIKVHSTRHLIHSAYKQSPHTTAFRDPCSHWTSADIRAHASIPQLRVTSKILNLWQSKMYTMAVRSSKKLQETRRLGVLTIPVRYFVQHLTIFQPHVLPEDVILPSSIYSTTLHQFYWY